jgi:hypothetical protein
MNLVELVKAAHKNSVDHGFWDASDPLQTSLPTKTSLIHSEISEALEEFRHTDEKRGGKLGDILFLGVDGKRGDGDFVYLGCGLCRTNAAPEHLHKPEGFIVELADVAIRLFDLTGFLKLEEKIESWFISETVIPQSPVPAELDEIHNRVSDLSRVLRTSFPDEIMASIIIGRTLNHLSMLSFQVSNDMPAFRQSHRSEDEVQRHSATNARRQNRMISLKQIDRVVRGFECTACGWQPQFEFAGDACKTCAPLRRTLSIKKFPIPPGHEEVPKRKKIT